MLKVHAMAQAGSHWPITTLVQVQVWTF